MSPRPKKLRTCCCPNSSSYDAIYKPSGVPLEELYITPLYHDELEALILCDDQDLNQEEAGKHMGVSRATVQRLLAQARKKVANALGEHKALAITPIEYSVK
jgi:uncharacterized protein